jgi:hypothetical protein
MLKNSSPQTTKEVKAGPPVKAVPPASPITLGDVGSTFSKYTLGTPNEYMPKWMTGALPRTLLTSGVLGLAGSYLAPKLLNRFSPGRANDPEFAQRARRVGGLGGVLLAVLANSPDLYSSFKSSIGRDTNGNPGHWSHGFKGLINGWENIAPGSSSPNTKPIWENWGTKQSNKQASVKEASFWTTPSIDPNAMTEATRLALYQGSIDPTAMLMASNAIDGAHKNSQGFMSPGSIGAAVARTALQAGVGAGLGYATGKVVGAMGGAFGLLSPATQSKIGPASALAGAMANILSGSSLLK